MQEQLPSLHAVNENFLSKFNAAHARKAVFQQAARENPSPQSLQKPTQPAHSSAPYHSVGSWRPFFTLGRAKNPLLWRGAPKGWGGRSLCCFLSAARCN